MLSGLTNIKFILNLYLQMHMDHLKLLAKPLDELQKEVPSMADLDEKSEANIAEVNKFSNILKFTILKYVFLHRSVES